MESYNKVKSFLEKRAHSRIKRNDNDFDLMINTLKLHPNYTNWKNKTVEYFRITRSPKKKAIQVHIKFKGLAKERQVSWVKCTDKKLAKVNKLTQAMRTAVTFQIEKWKNNFFGYRKCVLCNSTKNLEVDHYPTKFSKIKNDFLETTVSVVPKTFDWYKSRYHFKKQDKEFENEWSSYHYSLAEYRWLCIDCNQRF
jgi:hypothetical protein